MVAMMRPHTPPLICGVHAVESQKAGRNGCESQQLLPTHMSEIERYDLVGIRPDIREMIAGLDGRGRDVTGQEQEAGKPEQAMHERRYAFVEANGPLHPRPVDVAADVTMQMSA